MIQTLAKNEDGFTMAELLIAVVICAVLAAVGIPRFKKYLARARDAGRVAQLYSYKDVLNLYYNMNGSYPPNPTHGSACAVGTAGCLQELSSFMEFPVIQVNPTLGSAYPYYYYNYPGGPKAVVRGLMEGNTPNPCNFTVGDWCDPSKNASYWTTYCLCTGDPTGY